MNKARLYLKDKNEKISGMIRLKYKKGELILKEGDYGISIYKIINGKVGIFTESKGVEVPLAVLGPGKIIGEMVFLSLSGECRSASAKALEDSLLEVWHPQMLTEEYEQMPPILKHIADQVLNRLIRMNKLVARMTTKIEQEKERSELTCQEGDKRCYYRRQVNLYFEGRPAWDYSNRRVSGKIKDISLGGLRLEFRPRNVSKFPFKFGDELFLSTELPSGKKLDFIAKIITALKSEKPGTVLLGMSFTKLNNQVSKDLGFFLMHA